MALFSFYGSLNDATVLWIVCLNYSCFICFARLLSLYVLLFFQNIVCTGMMKWYPEPQHVHCFQSCEVRVKTAKQLCIKVFGDAFFLQSAFCPFAHEACHEDHHAKYCFRQISPKALKQLNEWMSILIKTDTSLKLICISVSCNATEHQGILWIYSLIPLG